MSNKGTDEFKKTILEYLKKEAFTNKLFAEKFKNPDKTIEGCVDYIIGTVQASGKNGFADDEIFGMAVHYYSEKNVKVKKKGNATVVVNHKKLLTGEEIEKAKKEAYDSVIAEEKAKIRKKSTKTESKDKPQENTLF